MNRTLSAVSNALDQIDRDILCELDYDSRQTIAALSQKLNLQRDRIAYRLNKLKSDGILVTYSTTVNPYKFGLVIYKMYLRLQNDQARIKRLVGDLKSHSNVYWVAECDGKWDLMVAVFASHPYQFREMLHEILNNYRDLVINFGIYTLTDSFLFRKGYLGRKSAEYMRIGGLHAEEKLEDLDYRLLKLLSSNARMSITGIAKRLKTTSRIAQYHLDKLEKNKVILGYRVFLDLSAIGISLFKAQIQLTSSDPKIEAKIFEYCKNDPNITYIVQQLGDCVLEIELEVNDYAHYNDIIADLRSKFPDTIREIETISIRKQYYRF